MSKPLKLPDDDGDLTVEVELDDIADRARRHPVEVKEEEILALIDRVLELEAVSTRLRKVMKAKNRLLVAYRLGGDQRVASAALTKLEKIGWTDRELDA